MNNTYYGTLIFELSKPGRKGYSLPKNELSDYSIAQLPENLLRQEAPATCCAMPAPTFPRLTSPRLCVTTMT